MVSEIKLPTVTIAIPAFNEEGFIEDIIKTFQKSGYPNIIEILIADGRSSDRTSEIVKLLSVEDPRVSLIDNPERIQSAGLNKLIHMAKGELFLRADAHCEYAEDYVEQSVKAFLESGALNVGGPQRFVARNTVQAYVSIAVENIFGSGGAKYRDKAYSGFADTVFLGCYHTETLKKLNGFLTDNVTNEDAELNIRLEKVKENAIYISPAIRVWYFPRNRFHGLFKQYYRYGKGRCLTAFRHSPYLSIRGSTPFITILILITVLISLLATGHLLLFLAGVGLILLSVCISVFFTVFRVKKRFFSDIWRGASVDAPGWIKLGFGAFFALIIMNLAHFLGYGVQLFRYLAGIKKW